MLLINIDSGAVRSLYTGESFPFTTGFGEGGGLWIAISAEDRSLHVGTDGSVIEEVDGFQTGGQSRCQPIQGSASRMLIDGTEYEGPCGLFSPDGRQMYYEVDRSSPGTPAGGYEAWLLDLDSGVRAMLSDALRHCGGCDGRAGAAWSPSGRYLLFGETYAGEDSTVYLADSEAGTVAVFPRQVGVVRPPYFSGGPSSTP